MFTKLDRTKVFRDPLYGYIEVDYKLISDLIDSQEFQRLRRIRQLSGVGHVFQTAEHSRFTHSLGAYQVANLVLRHVEGAKEYIKGYDEIVFLCSALLHDIGHGPYSHAFERVLTVSHEDMTVKLLKGNTEVNKMLEKASKGLSEDIASVIEHKGKFPLIESLVSSQLDVDRIDYLSRDAYFAGATYGIIDKERLLRSMIIKDGILYFRASGVNSIESYLMSRYHMYWQVYYHGVARSYELLLENIYRRIFDLVNEGKEIDANILELVNVIKNPDDLDSYISLDDSYVSGMIKQLIKSDDPVLRDLAISSERRYLYDYIEIDDTNKNKVKEIEDMYKDNPLKKYYYAKIEVKLVGYLEHTRRKTIDFNDIKILKKDSSVVSLSLVSPIMNGFIETGKKSITRIFYKEPLKYAK